MGLPIKKVLANVNQSLNASEAYTARNNIGATGIRNWGQVINGTHTVTAGEALDNIADISGTLDPRARGLLLICFDLAIDPDSPQVPTLDDVPAGVVPLLVVDGIERVLVAASWSGHISNFGSGNDDGLWGCSGTCLADSTSLLDSTVSLSLKAKVSWKAGAIPSGTQLQYSFRVYEFGACKP